MRIIDAHVHVGDNYKPLTPFRDTGRVDRLLRLMDECEVEKAVMVPVVAEFSPDNNSECARWSRQHPDRLAAMTDVAMHELSAIEEVARAREEYGAAANPWDFRCPRALGFFTALLLDLGPRRLLWGTDWPPTSSHLTYRQSLEIVRSCAEGVDEESLQQVLGENAAHVFGI